MLFFQRTFSPFTPFQCSGRFWPSPTPDAPGPRNCGQWPAVIGSGAASCPATAWAAEHPSHRKPVKSQNQIKSLTLTGAGEKVHGDCPRLFFGFCAIIKLLGAALGPGESLS